MGSQEIIETLGGYHIWHFSFVSDTADHVIWLEPIQVLFSN